MNWLPVDLDALLQYFRAADIEEQQLETETISVPVWDLLELVSFEPRGHATYVVSQAAAAGSYPLIEIQARETDLEVRQTIRAGANIEVSIYPNPTGTGGVTAPNLTWGKAITHQLRSFTLPVALLVAQCRIEAFPDPILVPAGHGLVFQRPAGGTTLAMDFYVREKWV